MEYEDSLMGRIKIGEATRLEGFKGGDTVELTPI